MRHILLCGLAVAGFGLFANVNTASADHCTSGGGYGYTGYSSGYGGGYRGYSNYGYVRPSVGYYSSGYRGNYYRGYRNRGGLGIQLNFGNRGYYGRRGGFSGYRGYRW